jgi:hypothetical protein
MLLQRRHDTPHNDNRLNNTQHNCTIQNYQSVTLSITCLILSVLSVAIEEHVLDTNARKQLSSAATDV